MGRVMVLGLRAFPGVQGGVESHAEQLYPLLVDAGWQVEAIVRSGYCPVDTKAWRGIEFRRVWSPRSKWLEALVHSLLGVALAAVRRPDILHIHAIGPALVSPVARLLGLRVVVTHHGADYERQKWGRFARAALRLGEAAGMRFTHGRIAVSKAISARMKTQFGATVEYIPNGAAIPEAPASLLALSKYELEPQRYILMVGRLVPEKRHTDLVEAFERADIANWKLVLVGGSDHPDDYSKTVAAFTKTRKNVVVTGVVTGLALQELYAHAGLFVLPSSHEGLPIALLEALGYGLPTLASNITANLEIGLPAEQYFEMGNVAALAAKLKAAAREPFPQSSRDLTRGWVREKFSWRAAANRTQEVYKRVLHGVSD